ncbi:MAG: hypothetical protein HN742_33225 [Lentisphaerae bacterium]|nr:hypothetical protein [Lentisphaerota bacterium]MBT4815969.1 hypothetical protein [Lentisphaerota bacterium]MBT5606568.1 hypothetical protein [Lentisphaerota bacterium]MBT7053477.1 hypothetical protein [Lentisphaerota bacterium]MBT7846780.1 hypothetical protein [Lentisphaerota bacterium]
MHKTFELDFPLKRTHLGMPMGNGDLGVLVWGQEKLHLTVSKIDFWDHRGGMWIAEGCTYDYIKANYDPEDGEKIQNALSSFQRELMAESGFWCSTRVPSGRFELTFADGAVPERVVLEYATGVVTVELSTGAVLTLTVGEAAPILFVRDETRAVERVDARSVWDFEQTVEWLESRGISPDERVDDARGCGWAQALPEDPSLACVAQRLPGGIAVSLARGEDNAAATASAFGAIATIDVPAFEQNASAWWGAYWEDMPEVELPDETHSAFLKLAFYKYGAANNPNSPLPSGLQGPWVEEYHKAQWSVDYHFNVNIQQIYTLGLPLGKFEFFGPLFAMLESESFRAIMRSNARSLFGIEDGLWLTHAVDDLGRQCGGVSAGAILDHACGAWTAQLYWLCYTHSGDETFLRERAYPFMLGIMRCYEEMLEERDGLLSIPVAISAEYGCRNQNGQRCGRDPSYQLAGIHMLLDALGKACAVLGEEPRPFWQEMSERIPPFTVFEGIDQYSKPSPRIAIWDGQDLELCHRHHSHLACIYPFDTLGASPTAEVQEVVENSVDHWIHRGMGEWSEWCMPWAAIIQARLGLAQGAELLMHIWRELFLNESMCSVYLPRFRGFSSHRRDDMKKPKGTSEVMQLEGTMIGAVALIEMLVHTHAGVMKLFGGAPPKWRDASFRDVRQPGPFRVSAVRSDGAFREAEITSLGPARLRLDIPGAGSVRVELRGRSFEASLPVELEFLEAEAARIHSC